MTPAMYEHQRAIVTPVREANTQIFGDPTNPNFRPLMDFGQLADNPQSAQRLGRALKLTFDQMDQQEKAHGTLTGLISAKMGMPQALADAKAAVQREVVSALTPEEQDAYDATITAFSSTVGLRSLTKASAAEFSVRAIERDIPVIGVNTTSSRMFYDKLAHLGELANNGAKTINDSVMPPSEKQFYQKKLEDLRTLKGKRGALSSPPKPGQAVSDDEIMNAVRAAKGGGTSNASAVPVQ
jgi:hypothetical protein